MAKKYGPKAQQKVKKVMREFKEGKLTSGHSGKKVRSRKQAIAIGLSKARKSGAKVPKVRFSELEEGFQAQVVPQANYIGAHPAGQADRHPLLNVELLFQRLFA